MKKKSFLKNLVTTTLASILMITAVNIYYSQKAEAAETGGYSTASGSNRSGVTVRNLSELERAFAERKNHIIIAGNISAGSNLKTFTFSDTGWNNTTIEGQPGTNPTLENIQIKFSGEQLQGGTNINNVVIKNITFRGRIQDLQRLSGNDIVPGGRGTNYLGISFRRTTNAWVDHCTIFDTSDDLMAILLNSDRITVSYCHFYFSNDWLRMNPNPMWNWVGKYQDLASERLAMVIGANKNDSYEYGGHKLHVTMHHNRFGPNIKGRPLLRGYVHLYNNYFDNSTAPNGTNSRGSSQGQYNANQIGSGSVVYSEGNYFYKTNQSNQIGLDSSGDKYSFFEKNNVYNQTTGNSARGAYFNNNFGYNYSAASANNVPNIVQGSAGAR